MSKKILIIVSVILLVVLVGVGGFFGGMAYKTNQQNQVQARFFEQRGGPPQGGQFQFDGQFPEGTPFPGDLSGTFNQAGGGFQGRGTMGQVKGIDGNILTLSTAQDVTTVNLSDTTTIQKSVEGSTNDLQPGVRVIVVGERDDQGNMNAIQITIVNNDTFPLP